MKSNKKPIKVVVIDDNHTTIELLKTVLEPQRFSLFGASSSIEELDTALKVDSDVFIIDTLSPQMDSLTICKVIREKSEAPILVLSAVNKPGMLERALNAGADEYLIKPVPANILIAHLKTLTRRFNQEQKAKYSYLGEPNINTNKLG